MLALNAVFTGKHGRNGSKQIEARTRTVEYFSRDFFDRRMVDEVLQGPCPDG
jgi:hypothetical protein